MTYIPGGVDFLTGRRKKAYRARWVQPVVGGRPVARTKCFVKREDAVAHLALVEAAIRRVGPSVLDEARGKPGVLRELIPLYHQDQIDRGITEMTIYNARHTLRLLDEQHPEITYIHEISFVVLKDFIKRNWKETADRGRQRLGQVKHFLGLMDRWGFYIDLRALKVVKGDLGKAYRVRQRGVWSSEQVRAIVRELTAPMPPKSELENGKSARGGLRVLESAYYRARVAFTPVFFLLIRYPIRPITACKLLVSDWHPQERRLVLRAEIVKNRREQVIVVDEAMAAILNWCAHLKEPHQPMFSAPSSYHLGPVAWNRGLMTEIMDKVLQRARVPGSSDPIPGSLYRAKHTATTQLLHESRADLRLVMQVTGHSKVENMEPYIGTPEDRQGEIVRYYETQNVPSDDAVVSQVVGFMLDAARPVPAPREPSPPGRLDPPPAPPIERTA